MKYPFVVKTFGGIIFRPIYYKKWAITFFILRRGRQKWFYYHKYCIGGWSLGLGIVEITELKRYEKTN